MAAKLDDVLSKLDSGPYIWIIFFLCALWGVFGGMHSMASAFLSVDMNHWCHTPALMKTNWTVEQKKNLSIPWISYEKGYSSCSMYSLNYSALSGLSFSEAMRSVTTNETIACVSWDYDRSVMKSSVVSEWDLVCERHYLKSLVQSIFMAGVLMSSPISGYISDRYGRKRNYTYSLIVLIISALLASVVTWYPAFLALRFIIAFTAYCVNQSSYVLAVEAASIRHRGTIGILYAIPFGLGNILLALIAYLQRDWRNIHLAISLPIVLLSANLLILPESPRWLIQTGKKKEAYKELQNAARWNRQKPFDERWLMTIIDKIHELGNIDHRKGKKSAYESEDGNKISAFTGLKILFGNLFMLKNTTVLSFIYITCTLVYYGLALNASNFRVDPFLYIAVGGAVEIVSLIIGNEITKVIGRRWIMISSMILTAITVLGPTVVFQVNNSSWYFFAIIMVGKMSISLAYIVIYLFISELYPTFIRTQGVGIVSMIGRTGAVLAPFVVDLGGSLVWYFPTIIFGLSCLFSGFLTVFLPETSKYELPTTVAEMENWGKKVVKYDNLTASNEEENTLLSTSE